MKEISKYKSEGFSGFVKVSDLRLKTSMIPNGKGVYIVLREIEDEPEFLECGTGGYFKGKDPNVDISILKDNIVLGSGTMYIGQTTNLRNRIRLLLRFGAGENVGHWGGRYLWQLADSENLLIAWKETPSEAPRAVESNMLADYVSDHGKLPFANLTDKH